MAKITQFKSPSVPKVSHEVVEEWFNSLEPNLAGLLRCLPLDIFRALLVDKDIEEYIGLYDLSPEDFLHEKAAGPLNEWILEYAPEVLTKNRTILILEAVEYIKSKIL